MDSADAKILHTSDWHVGKVLKGRSRARGAHRGARPRSIEIARAEQPDLVIVAGDLYDTAAPTAGRRPGWSPGRCPRCARPAREVVAIGGNHDNGPALDALRPWADAAGHRRCAARSATTPPTCIITGDDRRRANAGSSPPCRSCPSGTRSAPPRCTS